MKSGTDIGFLRLAGSVHSLVLSLSYPSTSGACGANHPNNQYQIAQIGGLMTFGYPSGHCTIDPSSHSRRINVSTEFGTAVQGGP